MSEPTSGQRYYTDEQIAIICHYMIMGVQLAIGQAAPSPPWEVQDPRFRALMIRSVAACRRVGAGPEDIHRIWDEGLRELGYQPGPVRNHGNTDNPTHPSVGVSYTELSPDERVKDDLTVLVTGYLAGVQRL